MNPVEGRSVVIVGYQPKPGKEEELLQLTREHLPILRAEGLATEREAIVCRAGDGTIIEVFEWEADGPQKAHANENVRALWERYWAVCDMVPLKDLTEAAQMFAGFAPVEL